MWTYLTLSSPPDTRQHSTVSRPAAPILLLFVLCALLASLSSTRVLATDFDLGSGFEYAWGTPYTDGNMPTGWSITSGNQDMPWAWYPYPYAFFSTCSTSPASIDMLTTRGTVPMLVSRALPLGPADRYNSWAISLDMFTGNICNTQQLTGGPHCQANPAIVIFDDANHPLVSVVWKVTDNPDPAQVRCELLVNGRPLVPTSYGMRATGDPTVPYVPNFDPAIADFTGQSLSMLAQHNQHYVLTICGNADGTITAMLDASQSSRFTVTAPIPPTGDIQRPAQLLFAPGAGGDTLGGGDFHFYRRLGSPTIDFVTDDPVAHDDAYVCMGNMAFMSPTGASVMQNDINPYGLPFSPSVVTDPAHGYVTLNADGSFIYTPDDGFAGEDSFTYQISDGLHTSNAATVRLTVLSPRSSDLAAGMNFNNFCQYITDTPPPPGWFSSPSTLPQGLAWWYGWGIYNDTQPCSFNISSTLFMDNGPDTPRDPLTVWRTLSLDPADPITGWGVKMNMYVNNIVNTTMPAGHLAADPHITMEDSNGQPIANIEWRVTDNADPALTANDVLVNGVSIIPTTFGVQPTNYWSDLHTTANFDPAIASWGDHTNRSFNLAFAAGADGHTVACLTSGGPAGTVLAPALGAIDPAHPAKLTFYAGNGRHAAGGGNFQVYQNPTDTIYFVYTHALPVDDCYQPSQDTPFTVAAPGVMGNDQNPDNAYLAAELVGAPAHGTVVLNPDGSFTYTPAAGFIGPDSFTYHLREDAAITSTATVHLQVRAFSLVQVVASTANLGSSSVQVPINLTAQGDENTIGFSLNFDPTMLSNPQVAAGADVPAGSQVLANTTAAAQGRIGLGIALPVGQTFAFGARQVAVITFTVAANPSASTTPVTFGNQPVKCELVTVAANPVGATWQNGTVALNHAPVAQNDSYTVNQNNALTLAAPGVLANDSDADGNILTAVLVSPTAHGVLKLHADGSFTYTPAHNYVGPDSFTYQVSDLFSLSNSATVTLTVAPTGYEADVAPRGDGDGQVTMADWVQIGRFVAGLDMPSSPSEYQRADCADRATQGDGQLTVVDWVQAGRYAVGLDALVPAGGPTMPGGSRAPRYQAAGKTPVLRTVSLAPATLTRGKTGAVQVVLNAQGNESALGFTLNFDPKQMKFLGAKLVGMASNATLNVNTAQAASGHVGIALMLPLPQTVKAGKQALVELIFQPLAFGPASLTFGDQCIAREVAGSTATALPATFINSTVMVRK